MQSLKYNFRNIPVRYDKRAICEISILYKVLKEALNEGLDLYMLIYTYKNHMFTIGYEKVDNQIKFYFGTEDGNSIGLNTIEELKEKTKYEDEVTVLRELQLYDTNVIPSIGGGVGAIAAKLFFNSIPENENIMEMSIGDNFIFKDFLVSSEDANFNYNLSDSQIIEFDNLLKEGEKNNKGMIIFLAGCVIFVVIIIVIAAIFGK